MSENLRGRDKFFKYKKIILFFSKLVNIFPNKIRCKLYEHFRMTKGVKGIVVRYILLKSIAKECGDNVSVHPGVYLLSPENISLGNNVSIHPMCYIDASGEIVIGNDVSIAHGVTIMSTEHNFSSLEIPIKDQGISFRATMINDDVWIGAKATILAGNSIDKGSIIAANSVVTHDVSKYSVIAGVPAREIKLRNRN